MTPVGFSLLSAAIGVVIFGSAIALGFQSSTGLVPMAGSGFGEYGDMREASVGDPTAENSSGTSDLAGPASLNRAFGASGAAAPARAPEADQLAFGAASTGAGAAAATDAVKIRTPPAAPVAKTTDAPDTADGPAAETRSASSKPLVGAVAEGRKPAAARAAAGGAVVTAQFERSAPFPFADSGTSIDGDVVIFDYPIPPMHPASQLDLGEDPLSAAARAVPADGNRPLVVSGALMPDAGVETRASAPEPGEVQPSLGPGLLNGSFVLSFNLSDEQLTLVFMVTGLLAVAIFLWFASSWLGDRATVKRQKLWERQQAEALAAAEEAEAKAGAGREQVAA